MKNLLLIVTSILIFDCTLFSQVNTTKNDNIQKHIYYLASDSLKGRFPGTIGDKLAANYIRNKFKSYGLKLLANNGFQYFDVITDVKEGEKNSFTFDTFVGKLNEDFIPFSFSENKIVEAEVVFAGYGFDINTDNLKWNDYKDIDVNGKWVMILRGDPEPDNTQSKFLDFESERNKVITAKDKGAVGVIFITGAEIEKKDELVQLYFDKIISNSGLPVINIKRSIANKIFEYLKDNKNLTIDSLEKQINKTKQSINFKIPLKIKVSTDIILNHAKTQNIVAMIEGNDKNLKKQYLIIGAHYDHIGMGGQGSGSRDPNNIAVHNGADDNASGVAAIIELARKLSENKNQLKRSIIFIAFGGEELGTVGSKYFLKSQLIDINKIDAMFNFDMVGRLKEETKQLSVAGSGTSLESDSILRKYGIDRTFELSLSPDGYGPSDYAVFYVEKIPVFFFTTGAHEDYHTQKDKYDKINFIGENAIVDYAYDVIYDVDNTKDLTFKESGTKHESKGARYKATLGIMPDFAAGEVKGLKVGGVNKNGPAEKGGIKKGDIIISINGQTVTNIYDYMARLSTLKQGQTVTVEVIRDNKKEVLLILL